MTKALIPAVCFAVAALCGASGLAVAKPHKPVPPPAPPPPVQSLDRVSTSAETLVGVGPIPRRRRLMIFLAERAYLGSQTLFLPLRPPFEARRHSWHTRGLQLAIRYDLVAGVEGPTGTILILISMVRPSRGLVQSSFGRPPFSAGIRADHPRRSLERSRRLWICRPARMDGLRYGRICRNEFETNADVDRSLIAARPLTLIRDLSAQRGRAGWSAAV